MDIFEKQQIIEAAKTLIKARWFFAAVVFIQGIILKIFKVPIPLASSYQLVLILLFAYFYNFIFWLYLRRPIEKINNAGLRVIKNFQLILDLIAISSILYFSGTVDKMVSVFFMVILMLSISVYSKKGIFLLVLIVLFSYTFLAFLEYYSLLPLEGGVQYFISARDDLNVLKLRLIGFGSYTIATGFFAWFLGDIFRKREKNLISQKNELVQKNEELLKAQKELQLALQKSEIAKKAAIQAREKMEKTNIELKKKIEELEKFYKITVGREVMMAELKEKIKELEEKLKEEKNI